jgi:hypothetical protein
MRLFCKETPGLEKRLGRFLYSYASTSLIVNRAALRAGMMLAKIDKTMTTAKRCNGLVKLIGHVNHRLDSSAVLRRSAYHGSASAISVNGIAASNDLSCTRRACFRTCANSAESSIFSARSPS